MQRNDRIRTLAGHTRFSIGALLVQPDRLVVVVDGSEHSLEPRTFEVLIALAEHAGDVVSAEQLLIEVWRGTFYGDNPVHKAIAQIRRVIGDDVRTPRYIETIRKRGYRLIAPVTFPERASQIPAPQPVWPDRSPYVGLSAFDETRAPVFFGRSRTCAELLAAMRTQIDCQRRFVLIVGPSGCGKTSLLHAGVLPLVKQPGGFAGLQARAVASCNLATLQSGDALECLATALGSWQIAGTPLLAPTSNESGILELLRSDSAIPEAIDAALRRMPGTGSPPPSHAHLLLVIDHAELLVTSPQIDDARRRAFGRALTRLCESLHVLVVMTTRSDFYPRLVDAIPAIADLKSGDGHVDVLTPRAGELAQIIRMPAQLAGLSFEEDAQSLVRLDDVLRDAAVAHPDALPLLQHTLQALYEHRRQDGLLTFAAYRDIGGLEGALAHRAEQVFASLPDGARRRLDAVFSQLIVIQADSDNVSARRATWASLSDDDARALVEAFIRARLFVGELTDGNPGFGVAHEALLRQWPRAQEWTQDNRRLLQARSRLQRATRRWVEEGRSDDHLLNPGRPLSEALETLQRLGDDLDTDERALLDASQRQSRRKQRRRIGAAAALVVLAFASALFAVLAQRARREAEQRREEALQLSDFMLVDLADKLRPLGNLKLLDSISTTALAQLERRPDAMLSPADLVNRSRALRTIGEVQMEQARLDEAQSAFRRATQAATAAVARAPDSADALAESGVAAYWLGYLHYRQNHFDEAGRHWTSYLSSSERLLALDPHNTTWQVELSYALNNLGTVAREQQRLDEAVRYFQRSAALKREVLAHKPDDPALRYDLIDTLSWISSADEAQGRLVDAAAGYAEQIGMLRRLLADRPDAKAWQRRLATSLVRSANLAVYRGRLDEAAAQIMESIERLSALTQAETDNRVWQRDLAHAHLLAAEIARLGGERATERQHLQAAQALIRPLAADRTSPQEWQILGAVIRFRVAAVDSAAAEAVTAMDGVLTDLRRHCAQMPEDVTCVTALANALVMYGRYVAGTGHASDARKAWLESVRVLEQSARDSADPRLLTPWMQARLLLGSDPPTAAAVARLQDMDYRHPELISIVDEIDHSTGIRR